LAITQMAGTTDIDDLFKLPLSEFTAARNASAVSLKDAGRAEDAAAVKALTKPSISAWAVNQLYWQHRKAFDQLLAAGEKLRKAQTEELTRQGAGGKGKGDLRAPIEALRSALTDLVKRGAAVLAASGHPPTPDLTRRITTTLEALATYGTQPGAPPAGRLTADVDPPGFEALSALVPRGKGKRAASSEPSRVLQFRPPAKASAKKLSPAARKQQEAQERAAQRTAAMAALREAERTLRDSRKALAQSQAALRKAAARAKVTEKAKAALEKRFEKVSADADAARQEARRVAAAAEEAAQSVQDAERAVEKAKQELTD
jgi:hypothetical protein